MNTSHVSKKAISNKAAGRSISSPVQVAQELWEAKESHQWRNARVNSSWNESPQANRKLDSFTLQKLVTVPDLGTSSRSAFHDSPAAAEKLKELDPEMGSSYPQFTVDPPLSSTNFEQVNQLPVSPQDRLVQALARVTSEINKEGSVSPLTTRRHSLDLVGIDDSETVPKHSLARSKSSVQRTLALCSLLMLIIFVFGMLLANKIQFPCLWFRCKPHPNVHNQPSITQPQEANNIDRQQEVERRSNDFANMNHRRQLLHGAYKEHYHNHRENGKSPMEEHSCVVSSTGECLAIIHTPDDERDNVKPLDQKLEEARHIDLPFTQLFQRRRFEHLKSKHHFEEFNQNMHHNLANSQDSTPEEETSRTEQLEGVRNVHNKRRGTANTMSSPRHRVVGVPSPTHRSKVDSTEHLCTSVNVHEFATWGDLNELRQCLMVHPEWVNDRDENHWTPLHEAASMGLLNVAAYLVRVGASVTAVNNLGRTPYQQALLDLGEHHEVTHFLQQYETDVRTGVIEHDVNGAKRERQGVSHAASDLFAQTDDCTVNQVQSNAFLGDLLELQRCLSRHPEWVNKAYNRGWTPIHYAARAGHTDIVKYLLQCGANVHAHTDFGNSVVDLASRHLGSDHPVVQLLLLQSLPSITVPVDSTGDKSENQPAESKENHSEDGTKAAPGNGEGTKSETVGKDVYKNGDSCIPQQIQWLADVGKLDELQRCLSLHPELINHADEKGWTPIHEAARAGHVDIIEYLIRVGANVDARTQLDHTALDLANRHGDDHPARLAFLQHESHQHKADESPSVDRAKTEHQDTVPLDGTNSVVHQSHESSQTPALIPTREGEVELEEQATKGRFCSPEHFKWSIHVGRLTEVKKCLTIHPEFSRGVDDLGWTPLHEASRAGHFDIVKYLLQFGLNAGTPNNHGQTPRDLAMERHGTESAVTQVLIEHSELSSVMTNPTAEATIVENHSLGNTPAAATQGSIKPPAAATHGSTNISTTKDDIQDNSNSDTTTTTATADCTQVDYLWSASLGELDNIKRCLSLHPSYLDATDENGWTAAHEAARSGHVKTVEYLLQAGANVHTLTVDGHQSPLDVARRVLGVDHAVTKLLSYKLPLVASH